MVRVRAVARYFLAIAEDAGALVVGMRHSEREVEEKRPRFTTRDEISRLIEKEIAGIHQPLGRVAGARDRSDLRDDVGQRHAFAVAPQKIRVVVVRVRLVEKTKRVIEAVFARLALVAGVAEAPLADERSRVTRRLQDARDRDITGAQHLRLGIFHASVAAHARVTHMQTRHKHAARGRTHRVARVKLRETHPFGRELIEVRGADNFLSVRAEVTVAEIVGQNENNIGPGSSSRGEARGKQNQDTNEAWRNIHGANRSQGSRAAAGKVCAPRAALKPLDNPSLCDTRGATAPSQPDRPRSLLSRRPTRRCDRACN